jgi:hypothetical protein
MDSISYLVFTGEIPRGSAWRYRPCFEVKFPNSKEAAERRKREAEATKEYRERELRRMGY